MIKEAIFLDNRFLPREEAKISVLDPGFLYGLGVFETMRFTGKGIVHLARHFQRLKDGCSAIGLKLPYRASKLKKIIKEASFLSGAEDVYLRITIWEAEGRAGFMLLAKEYKPLPLKKYREGFSAGVSSLRQDENSSFPKIKSTNRIIYELAYRKARKQGFDEALLLNTRGYITEATRSNIFIIKDGRILTPALSCGCLEGITRSIIFDLAKRSKIEISEGLVGLQDLYYCDEAFLTNSLMGVMPLTTVESHKIENRKIGRLTEMFMKKYGNLEKNAV